MLTKLNFQHHSSFQSSVSHDPSEIIVICRFAAQETFLIISIINKYNFWSIGSFTYVFLINYAYRVQMQKPLSAIWNFLLLEWSFLSSLYV